MTSSKSDFSQVSVSNTITLGLEYIFKSKYVLDAFNPFAPLKES